MLVKYVYLVQDRKGSVFVCDDFPDVTTIWSLRCVEMHFRIPEDGVEHNNVGLCFGVCCDDGRNRLYDTFEDAQEQLELCPTVTELPELDEIPNSIHTYPYHSFARLHKKSSV
jgi:hypothetical protein